jgi:predicted SAM-dependent methyltransferase
VRDETPRAAASAPPGEHTGGAEAPLRLHIGGTEPRPGWKILNVQPGTGVDFVGDCTDLGRFADASVQEIYASHVLEHLSYQDRLPRALGELYRVLRPGGKAMISVPDLEVLCRLFLDPRAKVRDRFEIMRMAFGGQMDAHDFHFVGLSYDLLYNFLFGAGFRRIEQVKAFGLFRDSSAIEYLGEPISLNVVAHR